MAGGNRDAPTGIWYEGTANKVQLWRPTLCAWAQNCLIFSTAGQGGLGKVLMLVDAAAMTELAMPAIRAGDDAFCISKSPANHATIERRPSSCCAQRYNSLMGWPMVWKQLVALGAVRVPAQTFRVTH